MSFLCDGDAVAAHLCLPDGIEDGAENPAIVLVPPATGVKEQTIGLYAEKLREEGFVTLAFDPRGWGESEGIPQYLSPYRIAEDAKSGMSFLLSLESVDPDHSYYMGICMGSGFAAFATATDARIRALVVLSPFYQQINGPKRRMIAERANHFDLYWRSEFVDPAVAEIVSFLGENQNRV